MPVGKSITQKQYDDTKNLLDISKLSMRNIGKIVGISGGTVARIRDSKTLEEMKATERIKRAGYNERRFSANNVVPQADQDTAQHTQTDDDTHALLSDTLQELLELKIMLADAISELYANDEKIIDLLTNPEQKKRGIFGR